MTLSVEGPRQVEPLRAEDTKNLGDMRKFLESAVTWPGVRKALESEQGRIPDSRFIETLLEKSRGVWIYLHYVVAEIERGERLPLRLDDLPKDLWQYYADYWKRWRDSHGQTWDSVDLPLLTTLAAAQESLPLDALLSPGRNRCPDARPPGDPPHARRRVEPLPGDLRGGLGGGPRLSLLPRQPPRVLHRVPIDPGI